MINIDKTGMRKNGKRSWLHSVSNLECTCFYLHLSRGKDAIEEMGLLPSYKGILCHDYYTAYYRNGSEHALSNRKLLNKPQRYQRRYRTILTNDKKKCPLKQQEPGKSGRTGQSKSRNLLDRLEGHQEGVLRFMKTAIICVFLSLVIMLIGNTHHAGASGELEINKGWNLISVPADSDVTVEMLFGHLLRGRVWSWIDNQLVALEPDSLLDPCKGYWLFSNQSEIVSIPNTTIAESAEYLVTFDATWSQFTHPVGFPSGAHFSPLIGASHSDTITFWESGGIATAGIESMAETGSTSNLITEIGNAQSNSHTATLPFDPVISGIGINSPDSTFITFTVHRDFPLVTLVAMIAPSPDWFIGVSGLNMIENGVWIESKTVSLRGYDAGTEEGVDFSLSNPSTNPQAPISILQDPPFKVDGEFIPLGTFTFERLR